MSAVRDKKTGDFFMAKNGIRCKSLLSFKNKTNIQNFSLKFLSLKFLFFAKLIAIWLRFCRPQKLLFLNLQILARIWRFQDSNVK